MLKHIRNYYTEDEPLVYRIGWIPLKEPYAGSQDILLFVQFFSFEIRHPRGTAFLFHGYASDSSWLSGIAGALLQRGWAVVLTDLPGHGLSTGPRGDIETFFDYGDTVERVVTTMKALASTYLPEPYVAIGHSTGALALLDYSLRYQNRFSRFSLYAPLVRQVWWNTARVVRAVTKPFIATTKALSRTPLGLRVFPLHWLDELILWERWARSHRFIPLPPTLVLQPEQDTVVDSRYNGRFIQSRSSTVTLKKLPDLTHFSLDSWNPNKALVDELLNFLE
ncbi:MAG: alpha/beta hydrolase [Termitinemataceae bacterium]